MFSFFFWAEKAVLWHSNDLQRTARVTKKSLLLQYIMFIYFTITGMIRIGFGNGVRLHEKFIA